MPLDVVTTEEKDILHATLPEINTSLELIKKLSQFNTYNKNLCASIQDKKDGKNDLSSLEASHLSTYPEQDRKDQPSVSGASATPPSNF